MTRSSVGGRRIGHEHRDRAGPPAGAARDDGWASRCWAGGGAGSVDAYDLAVLYSLAYESQASVPFTESDLLDLLGLSRTKNAELGITGTLLYRRGTFLQVLEGDRDRVEDLYATISDDPRHHAVDTVLVEDRSERRFPDWTMGFADVDGHLGDVDGFNDVLTSLQGPDGEESPQFRELLALFGNED